MSGWRLLCQLQALAGVAGAAWRAAAAVFACLLLAQWWLLELTPRCRSCSRGDLLEAKRRLPHSRSRGDVVASVASAFGASWLPWRRWCVWQLPLQAQELAGGRRSRVRVARHALLAHRLCCVCTWAVLRYAMQRKLSAPHSVQPCCCSWMEAPMPTSSTRQRHAVLAMSMRATAAWRASAAGPTLSQLLS